MKNTTKDEEIEKLKKQVEKLKSDKESLKRDKRGLLKESWLLLKLKPTSIMMHSKKKRHRKMGWTGRPSS